MSTKVWTIALAAALVAGAVLAEEASFSVEPGSDVRSVLASQAGKTVTLRLRAGEEIGGKVQLVGNQLVHLSQVTGRDFYDAAVRLDAIDAVIARARTQ